MSIGLVSSNTFTFADGNGGHACNFGSAPSVGDWDVLCVNSDTTVSTPSGWTLSRSRVANQGAYIFTRKAVGGEASTVTITTTGNFNTQVGWSRWSGGNAVDIAVDAGANASAGSTTPAVSTGTLAETGEVVIAFGAVHGAVTTTPVWSSGFTGLTAATQGTGASTATGYVGYKPGAGTAAESPNVSWTTPAPDRYILVISLTAAAGPTEKSDSDSASAVDAASLAASLSAGDTGSGGDTALTLAAALTAGDTAAAGETSSLAAVLAAADTGTAADQAAVSATVSAAETASAADTAALAAALTATDSGAAADVPSLAAALTSGDTAASSDTASPAGAALTAADTALAAEAAALAAALTAADTATATEHATASDTSISADYAARGTPTLRTIGSEVTLR